MERYGQRGNVLFGYNPSSSVEASSSRNSDACDVDFNDVFGGPPRRSSMHDHLRRNSSTGVMVQYSDQDMAVSRSSWPGMSNEKPVFGEEIGDRGRRDDFYDDIFRGGNGSNYGSPRKSSMPAGCMVLSPSRPLSPKADQAFSTSLPAHFSLPAKLTKGMDLPTFGSSNRSANKHKDGSSTPSTSLSRFSSQSFPELNDQSLLSTDLSFTTEEASYISKPTENEVGGNLKGGAKRVEALINSGRFHFSIYKWSTYGTPLLSPLRRGKSSASKENGTFERCLSSKGKLESCTENVHSSDSVFLSKDMSAIVKNTVESCQIVEEEVIEKPVSKPFETTQSKSTSFHVATTASKERVETNPGLSEVNEKGSSTLKQETNKHVLKHLRSLLHDEIEEQDNEEITNKGEGKENVEKVTVVSKSNVGASNKIKNHDGKRLNIKRPEVNKDAVGSPRNSGDSQAKGRVKGKVKDFVKIFNQEAPPKTKINVVSRSKSSRWKATGTNEGNREVSPDGATDYKKTVPNVKMEERIEKSGKQPAEQKTTTPDASFKVEERIENPSKQQSEQKTPAHKSNDYRFVQMDASATPASIPRDSNVTLGDLDDMFHESFQIEVLSPDEEIPSQTEKDSDVLRASDSKIQHWSSGKKGNIRSLLSTLQYVLWPESGWKPVPLVDVIEGGQVKRAYQRALLCLHPDKLQQKGAAFHQKYIAEKVFDILQEAWDEFNSSSIGAL